MHSDDLADACVFLMENISFRDMKNNKKNNGNGNGTPAEIRNTHINIGTGKDLTIKELAGLVKKVVGFDGLIEWTPQNPMVHSRSFSALKSLIRLGGRRE
jgi:GDP-L-fucose synthase